MIPAVVAPTGPAGQAYEQAANTILCDCGCHPQSVKECACGRAEQMRAAIAADAAQGKSGDQIVAAYVARYGQKILVSPPATGFNLVAWTGPAIGLVAAALLIGLTIRRWRAVSAAAPAEGAPLAGGVDESYRARLRDDLEKIR